MKKVVMFTAIVRNLTPKKGENVKLDTNGLPPMVVEAIGGTAPRPVNFISGTVAKGQGLEAGKNYIFKAVHTGLVESVANEGEMIEGFNLSSVGEIDVEKAIDWYERKDLNFLIETEETIAQTPTTEEKPVARRAKAETPAEEV